MVEQKPVPLHTTSGSPPPASPDTPEPPISDEDFWDHVVSLCAQTASDQAKIESLEHVDFDGRILRLKPVDDVDPRVARYLAQQSATIESLVARHTGRKVKVNIESPAAPAAPRTDAADYDEARSLPLVRRALDLFDATILDVQRAPAKPPADQKKGDD